MEDIEDVCFKFNLLLYFKKYFIYIDVFFYVCIL